MRFALVPVLAALCCPLIDAADTPAVDTAPETTTAKLGGSDLLGRLPTSALLVERDGSVFWDNAQGIAYRIVDVAKDGAALIETEIGQVQIPKGLLAGERSDCLTALPKLITTAQAGGIDAKVSLALAEGIMTGLHLRSAEVLVIDAGVLRKAPANESKPPLDQLKRAIDETKSGLATIEPLAKKAVEDILDRLALADDARKFEYDEVKPSFARQVVRSGWLRSLVKAPPVAQRLEAALAACEVMQPVALFTGDKLRLADMKNAFGQGGWVLETPQRTSFARSHPNPMYAWGSERWNLLLVVDLPAKSDPLADAGKAVAARLFQGTRQVASWSRESGFTSDAATWRSAVPDKGRHVDEQTVSNFLPPHIVVVDLDGDVRQLVTAHGVLVPARDTSTPEAERFLADAAKALPDAAHLDLIGEHLFYYVYDSPDSRQPSVIGNRQIKGDIHQTAFQTLATVANGVCRGDCDDLSELYQEIAERQGRIAHVISLPQHAACAFAEQKGEMWHTYVLQTGQPREFTAKTLQDSLRAAYLSFDESDNFDPNGLGLLLRFTGENTRGSWRLSYRIFSEADYAKTMIDVQKDWHFSTYQRGIHKMQEMIAAGDEDTANFRELAGLANFTGQYALAVEYFEKALERTAEPESRLYSSVELTADLYKAEQPERARALAERLLDKDLPGLKAEMGNRAFQFGFQLASVCSNGGDYDLAARAMNDTMLKGMSEQIEQIAGWISSPQFNQRRWEQLSQLRRLLQMYVGTCINVLEGLQDEADPAAKPGAKASQPDLSLSDNETAATLVRSVQTWLDRIAFHDVEEADDVLTRYTSAGMFYETLIGEDRLEAMLADVPMASDAKKVHTRRVGGIAQMGLDLPWIKTSPTYWYGKLRKATGDMDQAAATFDRDRIRSLTDKVLAAYDNIDALDIKDPWLDGIAHQTRLIRALIDEDEQALRERLRFVTAKDDKRLRDDSAQILGDLARGCSKDWYAKVLKAWVDECDYKPKYYWIAWRAALSKAPEHALMAAELAASRFKDDPDFQEELAFMRELFAGKVPAKAKPADTKKKEAKR